VLITKTPVELILGDEQSPEAKRGERENDKGGTTSCVYINTLLKGFSKAISYNHQSKSKNQNLLWRLHLATSNDTNTN
jgi:hypothetical protein